MHFTMTNFRLANNGFPKENQRRWCRVIFKAPKFTALIETTIRKIVKLLQQRGYCLVLSTSEGISWKPITILEIPDSPKDADYSLSTYSNPHECLPPSTIS
ncbi:hypothetical protein Ddye_022995 [Dipteronia dyeriana]|uniref:Uncharacterized protein n=1 Tax=Dipteronia dyeriana TaxID=168575 RepID=A0AAD9TSK6_9ROSI|nr:hypothetical protein Ddye_022995 [Dipteronia dyeriana]